MTVYCVNCCSEYHSYQNKLTGNVGLTTRKIVSVRSPNNGHLLTDPPLTSLTSFVRSSVFVRDRQNRRWIRLYGSVATRQDATSNAPDEGEAKTVLQETGGLLPLRRGALNASRGAGGAESEGLRGDGHDAEGAVRLPEASVRGTDHNHASDGGHFSGQALADEQHFEEGQVRGMTEYSSSPELIWSILFQQPVFLSLRSASGNRTHLRAGAHAATGRARLRHHQSSVSAGQDVSGAHNSLSQN